MIIYIILLLIYKIEASLLVAELTTLETKMLSNIIDKDVNGAINFSEFCTMWTKDNERDWSPEECLGAIFRETDKDENGSLSQFEIQKLLINNESILTETELQEFTKKMDLDGDGMVNYEEFLKS